MCNQYVLLVQHLCHQRYKLIPTKLKLYFKKLKRLLKSHSCFWSVEVWWVLLTGWDLRTAMARGEAKLKEKMSDWQHSTQIRPLLRETWEWLNASAVPGTHAPLHPGVISNHPALERSAVAAACRLVLSSQHRKDSCHSWVWFRSFSLQPLPYL